MTSLTMARKETEISKRVLNLDLTSVQRHKRIELAVNSYAACYAVQTKDKHRTHTIQYYQKNQRPLMKYRRNDKYDVLQSIAKKPKKESGGSP